MRPNEQHIAGFAGLDWFLYSVQKAPTGNPRGKVVGRDLTTGNDVYEFWIDTYPESEPDRALFKMVCDIAVVRYILNPVYTIR